MNYMVFWFVLRWTFVFFAYVGVYASVVYLGIKLGWI